MNAQERINRIIRTHGYTGFICKKISDDTFEIKNKFAPVEIPNILRFILQEMECNIIFEMGTYIEFKEFIHIGVEIMQLN